MLLTKQLCTDHHWCKELFRWYRLQCRKLEALSQLQSSLNLMKCNTLNPLDRGHWSICASVETQTWFESWYLRVYGTPKKTKCAELLEMLPCWPKRNKKPECNSIRCSAYNMCTCSMQCKRHQMQVHKWAMLTCCACFAHGLHAWHISIFCCSMPIVWRECFVNTLYVHDWAVSRNQLCKTNAYQKYVCCEALAFK